MLVGVTIVVVSLSALILGFTLVLHARMRESAAEAKANWPYSIYVLIVPIAIMLLFAYAKQVAPWYRPPFGGFILSHVDVTTVSGDVKGPHLLVASDSQSVVVAAPSSAGIFVLRITSNRRRDAQIVQIPWSDVRAIRGLD